MGRGSRFLPEVVSALVAFPGMWLCINVFGELWLRRNPFLTLEFLVCAVVLLSACAYRLAKRPSMWTHLPVQIGGTIVSLYPTFHSFGGIIILLAAFSAIVVTLPLCGIYSLLYKKRFTPSTDDDELTHEQL